MNKHMFAVETTYGTAPPQPGSLLLRKVELQPTDLFSDKKPRRKRRVMMRMDDAGQGLATFKCHKCGAVTDWLVASNQELRRGIPCDSCNGLEAKHARAV